MKNLDREEFLERMKDHTLTVFHDDGIYRHIRMANGTSYYDQFDIVTWPGYLAYSGDLGSFTFHRLEDMFKFFRGHDEPNLYYWSSKLEGTDRFGGHEEFSIELYEERIREEIKNCWEWENSEQKHRDMEDVEYELFNGFDNEIDARQATESYVSPFGDNRFTDVWEMDFKDYTYRFVLACYAIPWAIGKYDEYKLTLAHTSHS